MDVVITLNFCQFSAVTKPMHCPVLRGFILVTLLVCARPAISADALIEVSQRERIALIGNSLAERMNLYGHFETLLHTRFADKELVVRNFGWPCDEVGRS